jgi:N-acyl homoserine lactone hydrolase
MPSVTTACGHVGRRRHLLCALSSLGACRASGRPYDGARADASVERVAALADVVYPGHDRAIQLGTDGEFDHVEAAVPLEFRVP